MKKWVLVAGMLLAGTPSVVHGQGCSVCTKTASTLDSKAAKGLNGGILYLAFLPLTILGTVGFFWWRGGKRD